MTNATLRLEVTSREETGKKVSALRTQGKVPAVLYGHDIKPTNVTVDHAHFERVYKQAGESALVDLVVDGKEPVKVLIQDHQLNPTVSQFTHIDFHQVNMKEKIHTDIPIKFIGEASAVKELSAILVTNLDHLEVECLPSDLVHEIEVDLSSLKTFDDAIRVSDIKAPQGITIKNAPEESVVLVQEPRAEEKEVVPVEAVAPIVEGEQPATEATAESKPDKEKK